MHIHIYIYICIYLYLRLYTYIYAKKSSHLLSHLIKIDAYIYI